MVRKRVALISTGGTIEKTYDAKSGVLANHVRVLDIMLERLDLFGLILTHVPLMKKDSLDMTPGDHQAIAACAHAQAHTHDGVIVVHGTDHLAVSGDATLALGCPEVPVVFTGAMRPYELRTTDALQNLTEALVAVQLLGPGVYVAMQNQVLSFPGVTKDRSRGLFVKSSPQGL